MLGTIEKAGAVLDLFTMQRPDWTMSEIIEELDLPKSTAHGLLTSLVGAGLLRLTRRGRYEIGWRVLDLSARIGGFAGIEELAVPALERLGRRLSENVYLGLLHRGQVRCVRSVECRNVVTTPGPMVGDVLAPHCSAGAKAVLAFRPPREVERLIAASGLPRRTRATITVTEEVLAELASVRTAGYAVDREESSDGVFCVAAPIRLAPLPVTAAIGVRIPACRFSRHGELLVSTIVDAAAELSRALLTARRSGHEQPDRGGGDVAPPASAPPGDRRPAPRAARSAELPRQLGQQMILHSTAGRALRSG